MTPVIFNRSLIRQRLEKALQTSFLLQESAQRLRERLTLLTKRFETMVWIGPGSSVLKPYLRGDERVFVLDLGRTPKEGIRAYAQIDEEFLPLRQHSLDLIISHDLMQWVNDVPGVLAQIRYALKPDGLFLAAFVGGQTLCELRDCLARAEQELRGGVSPRVSPFLSVPDSAALLQRAGFSLPVADHDRMEVLYQNPLDLMKDLKAWGVTNALSQQSRQLLTPRVLERACALYEEKYEKDGKVPATFDLVYMTGWQGAPHQQKALKPGQGKISLAEALR
jgi:SAM-dependent methyltransferase